jgi:hypothetical protein
MADFEVDIAKTALRLIVLAFLVAGSSCDTAAIWRRSFPFGINSDA